MIGGLTTDPGQPPRISIVIPVYDREVYLAEAVDTVLAQTFTDWELVISDDGSTDGTPEVARRYADVDARIRVVSHTNGGVAIARNRGLAATNPTSELVILLDSDDLWEPDALETLVNALEAHPDCVSAHALADSVDVDGTPLEGDDLADRLRTRRGYRGDHLAPIPIDEPTTFAEMVNQNCVWTPGLQLIRRDVLDRVGQFDPATDPADDWDFAIRVSRQGNSVLVDRVILHWRRHDATLSSQSPRQREAYFAVRRKTLTDPTNTPDQRRVARLGYVTTAAGTMRAAGRLLRERQLRAAAHEAARAIDIYGRFVALAARQRITKSP